MSRKSLAALLLVLSLIACGGNDAAPDETTGTGDATASTTTEPAESDTGPVDPDEGSTTTQPPGTEETTATEVSATAEAPVTTEPTETPPATTAAEEGPDSTTPAATTSTTVYSGPVSPITGLPVTDMTMMDRGTIAVKIDNYRLANPQSGIEKAEAVFELVVESGILRFIALFHQTDSDWVGPMRSVRPTDWTLAKPLNAILQVSGGQRWIRSKVTDNGVRLIGDLGPPLTARWNQRPAPHNLYVDTYEAREVAANRGYASTPPPTMFERGPLSGPAGAIATNIFFDWTDVMDVLWLWDGTRYVRFENGEPHEWRDKEGSMTGQLSADVLVVLMADRYTACPSGEGSCVPAWDTVGENRAIVFADGRYAEARWSRDTASDWFEVTGPAGNPITVPPGRLWIMIYPKNAAIEW